METKGTNRRTCLVDVICGIIPVTEVKNSVQRSIIMARPSQGDTSISHANNALASHGMVLNRASKRYMRGGEGHRSTFYKNKNADLLFKSS